MRRPCVFHDRLADDANAKLYEHWPKVPIGAFQKIWRAEHCRQLDLYGTGSCPYPARDCVLAYYVAADKTMYETNGSPIGLFRKIARRMGAERADNKPLTRDTRTDGKPGDAAGPVGLRGDEGSNVRTARPRSLGSLFGEDDS